VKTLLYDCVLALAVSIDMLRPIHSIGNKVAVSGDDFVARYGDFVAKNGDFVAWCGQAFTARRLTNCRIITIIILLKAT